jgi:SAM-dependent methyltransferase
MDPTQRFSDRVEDYIRYRPTYPEGVIGLLTDETSLTPSSVIADVGSGTGISSELFLRNGNTVFGVEPNQEMRQAAERLLAEYPRFHSTIGRAEDTSLADASVEYVVAGQAFHWFDPRTARQEFQRILAPSGWIVLMWNTRRVDSTPFLGDYEALLQRYGTDYKQVQHRNIDVSMLSALFGGEIGRDFELRKLYNEQRVDFDGLRGRLLSSSYTPTANHPGYKPILRDLKRIFDEHADANAVSLEYDTEIYFGHLK